MKIITVVRIGTLASLMISLMIFSSCSRNTNQDTVSSESAAIVACPTTPVTTVSITNLAFQPNTLSIAVNDIVKWTNDDNVNHTVTSGTTPTPDGKFDSGTLT